jgi:hypothetical protein
VFSRSSLQLFLLFLHPFFNSVSYVSAIRVSFAFSPNNCLIKTSVFYFDLNRCFFKTSSMSLLRFLLCSVITSAGLYDYWLPHFIDISSCFDRGFTEHFPRLVPSTLRATFQLRTNRMGRRMGRSGLWRGWLCDDATVRSDYVKSSAGCGRYLGRDTFDQAGTGAGWILNTGRTK